MWGQPPFDFAQGRLSAVHRAQPGSSCVATNIQTQTARSFLASMYFRSTALIVL